MFTSDSVKCSGCEIPTFIRHKNQYAKFEVKTAWFIVTDRCAAPKGKGEEDYRPLFENFLADLLTTLYRPEWPATELTLNLLGSLLVIVITLNYDAIM